MKVTNAGTGRFPVEVAAPRGAGRRLGQDLPRIPGRPDHRRAGSGGVAGGPHPLPLRAPADCGGPGRERVAAPAAGGVGAVVGGVREGSFNVRGKPAECLRDRPPLPGFWENLGFLGPPLHLVEGPRLRTRRADCRSTASGRKPEYSSFPASMVTRPLSQRRTAGSPTGCMVPFSLVFLLAGAAGTYFLLVRPVSKLLASRRGRRPNAPSSPARWRRSRARTDPPTRSTSAISTSRAGTCANRTATTSGSAPPAAPRASRRSSTAIRRGRGSRAGSIPAIRPRPCSPGGSRRPICSA